MTHKRFSDRETPHIAVLDQTRFILANIEAVEAWFTVTTENGTEERELATTFANRHVLQEFTICVGWLLRPLVRTATVGGGMASTSWAMAAISI